MGEKERDRIERNMLLAEELGGKTFTVVAIGDDIGQEILEVARCRNVTAIVVGKPRHSRLVDLLYGSLVDKLIRNSIGINVYVIQVSAEEGHNPGISTAKEASALFPGGIRPEAWRLQLWLLQLAGCCSRSLSW